MAVLIRHNVGIGRVSFGRIACRNLHKGHVGATLEKLNLPRHHWLKEVEQAPEKATVRRMKDTYLRELGEARAELQGLFGPEERSAIVKPTVQEEERIRDTKKRRELNNEALRAYRMLRPQAAPFYEEDAMLGMKAKMNKITKEDTNLPDLPESAKANEFVDPFQQYLPVVNQKAFLFALESVTASLAKDLRVLCKWIHGPDSVSEEDGPQALGFRKLVDRLFDLKLKKDPDAAAGWVEKHWSLLEQLLPKEVVAPKEEKEEAIAKWLEGHLSRVKENQLRYEETDQKIFLHRERSAAEYYNFAEDFPYDDDPLPGLLADERNLDFPLEKATEFMQLFLRIISSSKCADDAKGILGEDGTVVADVANQFQDLVWSLEEIGLRNWLKMDLDELRRNLPQGPLSPLTLSSENADDLKLEPDDVEVAKTMLKCAARGKADLLDFEAVDPYKLLCGKPPNVDEFHKELSGLPEPVLCDEFLEDLIDEHKARIESRKNESQKEGSEWPLQGSARISDIYEKELEFYRTAGPVEFVESEGGGYTWKWRQPANTFWDERRKVYVQELKGVDPNLQLKELRQHMLDITPMRSMCSVGKVRYFRGIVVVGNGKGVYGFGIGFGSTPKECRSDSTLKALQNLDYIDYDPGRMLCTPCRGMEYKHTMKLIPRPIGRGLKANKKFLPLLYILGLDNCKVKFMFNKWFSRVKAIKRCLDQVISRRTLANMTGKRYALLVAPGDHWVHWPDRWFDETSKTYKDNQELRKLRRKHALHFKKRGTKIAVPDDVKHGWRKRNWARWNNALERWVQHRRDHYEPVSKAQSAPNMASGKSAS